VINHARDVDGQRVKRFDRVTGTALIGAASAVIAAGGALIAGLAIVSAWSVIPTRGRTLFAMFLRFA
jgi:hypothetical protein